MAWNDPDGNDRDPWKNRGRDQGPPDLDEVLRKMQAKLGGLFGGGPRVQRDGESGMLWLLVGLIVVAVLIHEVVYVIAPAERGLVLRFGRYVTTLQPGPAFRFPRPIEEVIKVNVERIQTLTAQSAMLTGDENIVEVELAVQYRIKDAQAYLFQISDPDDSVQRVTESAIRDIIGQNKLDYVITEGRAVIATGVQTLLQQVLDSYQSGIEITSVNMQPAKPPEEVKASFDDAIKAREDLQRKINDAEAYRSEVVERSLGEADRIRLDADGYKQSVVAQAEGEAKRFELLLAQYELAPEVTRNRLYLDAMEGVMSASSKVVIDTKGSNNMMYIPLDKLLEKANSRVPTAAAEVDQQGLPYAPQVEESLLDRRSNRARAVR